MENNYLFILKRDKPLFINIIGGMILFFALMRILNSPISGVLMTVASLGLFAFQSGIEINFQEKFYRNVSIIGPQSFGKWMPLPELGYISLFKTNLVYTATGRSGTSVSQKSSIIQVSLVGTENQKIKVYEGKDKNEAIAKAKEFSKLFNIDIWDATIRPADWFRE
jgi:hypothetical protein